MRSLIVAVTVSMAAALPVTAQERGVEVGIGLAEVGTQLSRRSSTLPSQNLNALAATFRAGWFVSDHLAVEPSLAASVLSAQDANITSLGLGVGLPYYFSGSSGRRGIYVRPFGSISFLFAGASGVADTDAQLNTGLGLGLKVPLAGRVALRLEGNSTYAFKSGAFGDLLHLGGFVGLSVFTR